MKTRLPSVERIGIISGLVTALALTAYFLIMDALGYSHILELRFFNFVILGVGISYAISRYKSQVPGEEFYLKGWAQGIYTAVVATVTFGIFMAFYLSYFDPALLAHIREQATTGQVTNGLTIFLSILLEGMASGFVITLSAMQYFKKDTSRPKHHIENPDVNPIKRDPKLRVERTDNRL